MHRNTAFHLERISIDHMLGNVDWPFTQSKKLDFPNASSGMLNVYWSKVHEVALQLPGIVDLFNRRTGTNAWVIDPNRFRLAPTGTGGIETAHTDHSCLDVNRVEHAVNL